MGREKKVDESTWINRENLEKKPGEERASFHHTILFPPDTNKI